jgi:uncharacterized protein (DUF1330 family)
MAAYLIANVEIHDAQGYEYYKEKASAAVRKFGGRYLARGGRHEVLEGTWTPTRLVLLEFPDMAALEAWYGSSDYAMAKPFRLANARSDFVALEGL